MSRFAWLTDIHLNHVTPERERQFLRELAANEPDGVLIGGDVSESMELVPHLKRIAATLACPVYFVLGNHDYYFSSIHRVRHVVSQLCREVPRLIWLNEAGVVELAPGVGLVGCDGWADGKLGDYVTSSVMLNDYLLIEELKELTPGERWETLKWLADAEAEIVARVLPEALEKFPHAVLLTHVPPFRESCWHEGRISNDEWLPHFSSKIMGDAILAVMQQHPNHQLTVLCGHTHSPGECRPRDNVTVFTGGATYGAPAVQRVFHWE